MPLEASLKIQKRTENKQTNNNNITTLCLKLIEPVLIEINV